MRQGLAEWERERGSDSRYRKKECEAGTCGAGERTRQRHAELDKRECEAVRHMVKGLTL